MGHVGCQLITIAGQSNACETDHHGIEAPLTGASPTAKGHLPECSPAAAKSTRPTPTRTNPHATIIPSAVSCDESEKSVTT